MHERWLSEQEITTLPLLLISAILCHLNEVNSQKGLPVKGFSGRDVIIKCNFKGSQGNKETYFGKVDANKTCPRDKPSTKEDSRVSKHYNNQRGILNVHIRKLTVKDSGTYLCGTHKGDECISLTLSVKGNILFYVITFQQFSYTVQLVFY